ncbi:TVP38/TMEM64 family protein [Clostridium butyricum]|uniref:TVP38/TMEM64 family protein n=1 Tax=Clostridium butyricum TaxID=1492 RepID=UPI002ABE95DC|nr:VTT domain-containing protein [Clostridium butyricum]
MNKERTLKISAVFIAILLTALLCAFMPKLLLMTVSLDEFNKYILSMGNLGVFMLIFFQILQTVVAPIPGEVIQIAGGYVYGLPLGTIYSLIGLIIGSGIAFYFTRLIGGDFIANLLRKKKLKWMLDIMESRKFEIILFIIFNARTSKRFYDICSWTYNFETYEILYDFNSKQIALDNGISKCWGKHKCWKLSSYYNCINYSYYWIYNRNIL